MTAPMLDLCYLVSSVLFILCLRGLSTPEGARRGVLLGEIGMLIAVVATLLHWEIVRYDFIIAGLVLGALLGTAISLKIPMTKMPERIALSHSFGGLATALVGVSEFYTRTAGRAPGAAVDIPRLTMGALGFEVFLGLLTFTGSIMAYAKLRGLVRGAPITFRGQNVLNVGAFAVAVGLLALQVRAPGQSPWMLYSIGAIGLVVGVTAVIPIGGADMPVVISLMNSYAGLAASATGFALGSKILVICGALDGASGLLLSMLMSKAMNRSFTNVLFGAFGATTESATAASGAATKYNEATVEDAAEVLKAAQSVIVVPGYGMAVSQAQHAVRDVCAQLEKRGCEIKYAIHPVAGRMPGHMNVLLAEANVPYDKLYDLDMVNDDFSNTDAVIVVGANDVVNPAAKKDPKSPIYGMPVFDVDKARSVIVLKRSMSPGFSGQDNELFSLSNTMMVLGDAKKSLMALLGEVKEAH